MTEAEWLTCADPVPILEFLRGKASDRKLRLFAVACCRRIWHLLTDDRSRAGVEAAERYADGCLSVDALRHARVAAHEAFLAVKIEEYMAEAEAGFCDSARYSSVCGRLVAAMAARAAVSGRADEPIGVLDAYWDDRTPEEDAEEARRRQRRRAGGPHWAARAAGNAARSRVFALQPRPPAIEEFHSPVWLAAESAANAARRSEAVAQAALLHDVFGNPFRLVTADPSWLAWHDGAIPKLAQSIYGDRALDRLPLLADALEAAGCTDAAILAHCRQSGEHVRGCWVVDLVLGRQ